MDPGDSLLTQGIAAARVGDQNAARRLLTQAVRHDVNSEPAWLWLGAVLKTPQGRAFCLRRALELNPDHETARRGLEAVEQTPRAPVLVAQPRAAALPSPVLTRSFPATRQLARRLQPRTGPGERPSPSAFSRVAKYTLVRMITLCLMVAVGAFFAIILINFGGFIDEIFRDRIGWAIMGMSMDMQDVPPEQRFPILEQAEQEMTKAYGLDQPFLLRCLFWLWRSLTLNWGASTDFVTLGGDAGEVWRVILERIPNTLLLAGASNLLLFFATVFLALYLSRKYGSLLDRIVIALSPISSAPNWVHGIILTLIFAAELHLLPFGGKFDAMPPDTEIGYVLVVLKHMILPVAAIFLSMFFQSVYAWRTFFLLHSGEDYVEFAEAQGLSPRTVERRYILKPTLPYIITSFTLMLITFWQGTVALEIFFHWPGIGALFIESIQRVDRTTVIGLVMVFAYLLAISVFLLDIIYALVDPRVKVGDGGSSADATVGRKRRRSWRKWWARQPVVRRPEHVWATQYEDPPAANGRTRAVFRDRVNRSLSALGPTLREIRRYPSAVVGLVIIVLLVGVSIYTVLAIPYGEAVTRWHIDRESLYRNPKNAQPEWINLFRRDDLPGPSS